MLSLTKQIRFQLRDIFGLNEADIYYFKALSINNLSDLVNLNFNEISMTYHRHRDEFDQIQRFAGMLLQKLLPNNDYNTMKPVIWIGIDYFAFLDKNQELKISKSVDILSEINEKYEIITTGSSDQIEYHNSWTSYLERYLLLGYRIDHDYIFQKLTDKQSVNPKLLKLRNDHEDRLQLITNRDISLVCQYLREINIIQRSMVNYSKQSRKS